MIDSHCHINDPAYSGEPKKYIEEAQSSGVSLMLVIGYDVASSKLAVKFANQFDCVYAAVGIHPSEVRKMKDGDLDIIAELLKEKKVLAIGEIGLDFYWDKEESIRSAQRAMFIKQIELANQCHKPIVVHCRDAHQECFEMLKKQHVEQKGIIHCYSSSVEMVKGFVDLGYILGLGGTVTFKNAVTPKEVAKVVPSDSFVLETDAPYLAPTPFRGELNHSKFLYLIRDEIAHLRNQTPKEVEEETDANFRRLFHL